MGRSAMELALATRCNNLVKENKELRLTNQRLEAEVARLRRVHADACEQLSKHLDRISILEARNGLPRIKELEAEVERMRKIVPDKDHYVAWLRYLPHDQDTPGVIEVTDSDADGAFKVFRLRSLESRGEQKGER